MKKPESTTQDGIEERHGGRLRGPFTSDVTVPCSQDDD